MAILASTWQFCAQRLAFIPTSMNRGRAGGGGGGRGGGGGGGGGEGEVLEGVLEAEQKETAKWASVKCRWRSRTRNRCVVGKSMCRI